MVEKVILMELSGEAIWSFFSAIFEWIGSICKKPKEMGLLSVKLEKYFSIDFWLVDDLAGAILHIHKLMSLPVQKLPGAHLQGFILQDSCH
jgi:hypothetical protein